MTFSAPTIMGGDFQIDTESDILSICSVTYDEYFNNNRRLDRHIIEKNLDIISYYIKNHVSHLAYHVLGFFIIRSGAQIPKSLKDEIIKSLDWSLDKKVNWKEDWIEIRKFYLNDLRNRLKLHKAGNINHLIDLKIIENIDFQTISVGLVQFNKNFSSKNFSSIEYINLDTCNLFEFPHQILSFKNLKILSLANNKIKILPDSVDTLKNLEALYLNGNNLEELPSTVGSLRSLQTLDLRNNYLKNIPSTIQNLKFLKSIFLQNNSINTIPKVLKKLINPCFIGI